MREHFKKVKTEALDLGDGCKVTYYPNFLPWSVSRELLPRLKESLPLKKRKVIIRGMTLDQPRLISWHGDPDANYTYSGLSLTPDPWTKELEKIKGWLHTFLNITFNSVLVNYYQTGSDYVGWHSDDERGLGPSPANIIIAAVSFGGPRTFGLFNKKRGLRHNIEPQCGSLLVMEGQTQKHWMHSITKTKKKVNERLSLTYRQVVIPK